MCRGKIPEGNSLGFDCGVAICLKDMHAAANFLRHFVAGDAYKFCVAITTESNRQNLSMIL